MMMSVKKPALKKHVIYHKNGSIWAKGQKCGDVCVGYWEWFRADGTLMRSGYFDERGQKIGAWTTYDKNGQVYKVTTVTRKKNKNA